MNGETQAPEKKRGQDVILPARIFDNGTWFKLTPSSQKVYIMLRRFMNPRTGRTYFTFPGLRARAHIPARKTLHDAMNELEKYGLILNRVKAGDVLRSLVNYPMPKNTWVFDTDPVTYE